MLHYLIHTSVMHSYLDVYILYCAALFSLYYHDNFLSKMASESISEKVENIFPGGYPRPPCYVFLGCCPPPPPSLRNKTFLYETLHVFYSLTSRNVLRSMLINTSISSMTAWTLYKKHMHVCIYIVHAL